MKKADVGNVEATTEQITSLQQETQSPQTQQPFSGVTETLNQIKAALKHTHMCIEQQIASSLSQAIEHISDSGRLKIMVETCEQISNMISSRPDAWTKELPALKRALQDLAKDLSQFTEDSQKKALESMISSVSALAQAHTSSGQAQTSSKLSEMVKRALDVTEWLQTPSRIVQ